MCLSIAIHRPNDVLCHKKHVGFEFIVVHNCGGYRCGYIKVEKCHPWHGKGWESEIGVHGGVTFAENDEPCDKGGEDTGYWIGFDCAHSGDAPDPKLPNTRGSLPFSMFGIDGIVRTQEYVESECRSLCEQAEKAAI